MHRAGSPRFDVPGLESYFGGKGGQVAVRRLINAFPPHRVFIEPCLGSGRILRHKAPAADGNFGFDVDPQLVGMWHGHTPPGYTVAVGDIFTTLPAVLAQSSRRGILPADVLVYVDPPYLLHTRRNPVPTYRHEFSTRDHIRLIALLQGLNCRVVLSHLPCPEYSEAFAQWSTFTFQNATRRGPQTEQVWCNFRPSVTLHEYTFVGDNKRHREQIRRHFSVILRRAAKLPPSARVALAAALEGLNDCDPTR